MLKTDPKADFAAINQSQLKTFARAAMAELDQHLQPRGGAGAAIHDLVASWEEPDLSGLRSDFAAVNASQLKTVARPFYERLIEVGYTSDYPLGFNFVVQLLSSPLPKMGLLDFGFESKPVKAAVAFAARDRYCYGILTSQ